MELFNFLINCFFVFAVVGLFLFEDSGPVFNSVFFYILKDSFSISPIMLRAFSENIRAVQLIPFLLFSFYIFLMSSGINSVGCTRATCTNCAFAIFFACIVRKIIQTLKQETFITFLHTKFYTAYQ